LSKSGKRQYEILKGKMGRQSDFGREKETAGVLGKSIKRKEPRPKQGRQSGV